MTTTRADFGNCRQFILTQQDFDAFARLSGDHNPIHVNPEFAAGTDFGRTVAHGMLLFSLLRGELMGRFPDYTLKQQSLMFPAPAFADETLTLKLRPTQDNPAMVSATITRADGETVLQGDCRLQVIAQDTAK